MSWLSKWLKVDARYRDGRVTISADRKTWDNFEREYDRFMIGLLRDKNVPPSYAEAIADEVWEWLTRKVNVKG